MLSISDRAKPTVAAASLSSYLDRVRAENSNIQAVPGSIWIDSGRLTRMATDVRAMRPHDLISVVVSENLAASTDGTVKNSRASNASSAISGLFGTLHAGNALQNLINQTSSSGLNAQGTSATNSSLSTTFGGQVIEVLPNGMLVIEAARQVEFSQQTQTIILRGLVRPKTSLSKIKFCRPPSQVLNWKCVGRELSTTTPIARTPSFGFFKKY